MVSGIHQFGRSDRVTSPKIGACMITSSASSQRITLVRLIPLPPYINTSPINRNYPERQREKRSELANEATIQNTSMHMDMHPASLHPPSHGGDGGGGADDPAAAAEVPSPASWALLDFRAYFADRRNSTTAACWTRHGEEIQVTIFPAPPPRVSHLCVYCPAVKPSHFAMEPRVLATDTRFLLLRVAICTPDELYCPTAYEYYIYRAYSAGDNDDTGGGGGRRRRRPPPSLELLPPNPYFFYDNQVGILSRGDEEYTVVALRDDASASHRGGSSVPAGVYDVCLFRPEENTWTIIAVLVPSDEQQRCNNGDEGFQHETSKVLTVGGEAGTLAFVDLWRGILLFDALSPCNNSTLRYFMLPPPSELMTRKWGYESPCYTRDIVAVNGQFKFVEFLSKMCIAKGSSDRGYMNDGWVASMWSKEATSPPEDAWCPGPKLESHDISFDHNSKLLPKLPAGDEGNKPHMVLERLHTGHPTLGLHGDGILYLMTKDKLKDNNAWVIAVDLRAGRLQGVAEIGAERIVPIVLTYTQSTISEHLLMHSTKSV